MSKEIPDQVLVLMAEKFRMLSEPTRRMILRSLMSQGEVNVSQIVERTGSTQANISKHLKQLAVAGLIQGQRTLTSFSGKDLHQKIDAPSRHAAFHDVALLAGVLLD